MQIIKSKNYSWLVLLFIFAIIIGQVFIPFAEDFKSIIKTLLLITLLCWGYWELFGLVKSKFETYLERRIQEILKNKSQF